MLLVVGSYRSRGSWVWVNVVGKQSIEKHERKTWCRETDRTLQLALRVLVYVYLLLG